jgi:internalin A
MPKQSRNVPKVIQALEKKWNITFEQGWHEGAYSDSNHYALVGDRIQKLYLSKVEFTERDMADLPHLEHLILFRCTFDLLTVLPSLHSLTALGLYDQNIVDYSPLASLTALTQLGLGGNQIQDCSPLASLTALTQLYLHNNQIQNCSPLASLTSLTQLHLYNNQIQDCSPLSSLTSLTDPLD